MVQNQYYIFKDMKIFYSEFVKDYSSYTFSYAPYAILESGDEFHTIYAQGFLPYTGNIDLHYGIYYMARSLRVNLQKFKIGSENRRVLRKFEDITFDRKITPIESFDIDHPDFLRFCSDYGAARFKGGAMAPERLQYILNSPMLTHIITYVHEGKDIGYVLVCLDNTMMHYWFSFFSLEDFTDLPLGKYLMLDSIVYAQNHGLEYCYLGTCYGAHSLYKVRDFSGVEFSEGGCWNDDVKELKLRCKNDVEPLPMDRFKMKEVDSANQFLATQLNA